jgi:hypothetical protein
MSWNGGRLDAHEGRAVPSSSTLCDELGRWEKVKATKKGGNPAALWRLSQHGAMLNARSNALPPHSPLETPLGCTRFLCE